MDDINTTSILVASAVAISGYLAYRFMTAGSGRHRIEAQRKILQAVPITKPGEKESAIYRNPESKDKLLEQSNPNIKTLVDLFNDTAAKYPNKPFLGTRVKAGKVGPYEFETYGELKKKRDALGSGLVLLGQKKGRPVGIYSINRSEWMITDLACSAYGFPSVALYDTLGKDAVEYIINHAELEVVVSSGGKQLKTLFAAKKNCANFKIIICMDSLTPEEEAEAKKLGLELYLLDKIMKDGNDKPQPFATVASTDIYTIMYTSGTTGNPKGVVLTHRNGVSEVAGVLNHEVGLFSDNEVHISYLPLAHSFERTVSYLIIAIAGCIGYFQGVITELFNDIATLKPTFLIGAPRVWNRLQDKVKLTISQSSPFRQFLFNYAYSAKKAALESGESTQLWDRLVFSKTKARLGGRVKWILSGSAPLDPKLGEFLKITFACPILEGYGLTENFAGALITHTNETQLGHVGSVLKCTEFKLQDIPEMDYSTSSNPPKGEILLRGPNIFREYYKDEKQTKEAFDPDGWFHTGDVGRINPNGTLSIIDRKKNIFKLEQGEYVAVEYLEGVFVQSKYVAQIWVYGSSFKRYLVAIVVPDPDVLFPYAKEKGLPEDLPALCKDDSIKKLIFDDLTATAKDAKLHGFEFVKAIHLSPESFSVDNDTMTPTFKLRRPQLLKRYKDQIDELYAYLDANPPASS